MPRPRDRASGAGLVQRIESRVWKDKKTVSYRYHPHGEKPTPWSTDREAVQRLALDASGRTAGYGSMRWLWEQWLETRDYLRLAEGTKTDYALAWKQIDARLGHLQASSITAPQVARYVHIDRAKSPRRANIEKALLSNLFKHGVLLGVALGNPTLGVKPHSSEPSDVMPSETVLAAFAAWLEAKGGQRRVLAYAARFAALAGSRQVEFIDLSWPQVDEKAGVVRLKRAKQRGKKRGEVIEAVAISPKLAALLAEIRALGRDCLYLFPTEDNNAYTARGFKTLWQRAVHAATEAKVMRPQDRFNFHALRRHYATMHKAQHGTLPDLHADARVTARVYDATVEVGRKAL